MSSYPNESTLLTLNDVCNLMGCNEVGDKVIIETKFHTVEGELSYIDNRGRIKVRYNALDAGYLAGYALEGCDVVSIRCFVCCDDRYYALETCEDGLTAEALNALVGTDKPDGQLYVYSGPRHEPECLWKYNGFGDHLDPDNWADAYGNLSAQFPQMDENQLGAFVGWLTTIFDGNGISFNADIVNGKVVVTVSGDGYVGAPSFTVDYEDGYVNLNPGDGSTPTTLIFRENGDGPPSGPPFNWFTYVNDVTNEVYLNNGGIAYLLGQLEDGHLNTCTGVVNCIVNNIANPPQPDQYAMPEVHEGLSNLRINQVTYGTGPVLAANFDVCTDSSANLNALVASLNSCVNNPLGWEWLNNGGVLTLCVPTGTHILTVSYDADYKVLNFGGVPTVPGDSYPSVMSAIIAGLAATGGSFGYTALDNEVAIENFYIGSSVATVRWTDEDGDNRISYKDPINGWYHPVEKTINAIEVLGINCNGTSSSGADSVNYVTYGVPENARKIVLRLQVYTQHGTGSTTGTIGSPTVDESSPVRAINQANIAGTMSYNTVIGEVPVSGGTIQISHNVNGSGGLAIAKAWVIGWKR